MQLGNLKISTKILSIIVLLAAICAGITATSIAGLGALSRASDELQLAGEEMKLGARINRMVVELSRDEYRLAANPSDLPQVMQSIGKTREAMDGLLAKVKGTSDAEQGRLLASFESSLVLYQKELEDTIAVARRIKGGGDLTRDQRDILASVEASAAAARTLQDLTVAYTTYTDDKASQLSKNATDLAETRSTQLTIAAAVGILAGLLLGWMVSQFGIVRPVKAIVACLRGLADSKLDTVVYGTDRRDEVGEIAETAEVFKRNLIRNQEMEREAKEVAARSQAEKRAAMLALASRFESQVGVIVNDVGGAATELQATAAQLSSAVEEVGAQCGAVAGASEEASANVQTVAAASEEMSASIHELAERVTRAAARSKAAAEGANLAQTQLDSLSAAIEQVDQIVASINAVASQTNLLALNATIEAARAGEAGKGFAVVASEVKNLANQTHAMTEQIGNQIAAVKSASGRTVEAMRAIITQVEDIDRSTAEMAASVEQQSAATGEISRNAQQAANGTAEVSSNVAGIQQAESETSAATHSVKTAADQLAERASSLKREVDQFLSEVRAA
ncbi:MCP four helix bundle domain-containing protein [Azospirillum sp. YIM DDC1]|uniref:MCP four helix bundle domain-containing protein n=1 Tax=Azospirillum aestuarii TaxID=2802052 RepID=A0ABS1HZ38_9PROT|nr:methyl-accepting chemotaxis protein [Azospirillum aestuarii]MBK4720087.1 MCP four helix bundle domain-containing protein [Azospirillum aestuarii]TWA89741.1 methyl-accepting chemotaxis protein [Azospirillum brasilense]